MSQNSQLHLTNDSFIYACHSEFAARTKKDGSFNSHIRFEDFLTGTFRRPENPSMKDVSQIFSAIAKHHTQITPQFRRREPINLETVAYFTCAIATLFADLESACKELFGTGMPIIPENPPEYSAEAPVSNALLAARTGYLRNLQSETAEPAPFEAFPRPDFSTLTAEQQAQVWACEMWDMLADVLHTTFGEYADAAMGFAYWKYQEQPAKEQIDWRVRPPVGEAYAKAFKPLLRSSRGDRGDRKGRHEGSDRRDDRPQRGRNSERSESRHGAEKNPERTDERPRRDSHESRPVRDDSAERHDDRNKRNKPSDHQRDATQDVKEHNDRRPDRADRGRGRRDGYEGGGRSRRPEGQDTGARGQSSEESLSTALEEVRLAADKLRKNPALNEIQLQPNNSFLRRQQHSLAVELGFDTESRGEGRDRGVVIRLAQN